jgi:hypothetical protein
LLHAAPQAGSWKVPKNAPRKERNLVPPKTRLHAQGIEKMRPLKDEIESSHVIGRRTRFLAN